MDAHEDDTSKLLSRYRCHCTCHDSSHHGEECQYHPDELGAAGKPITCHVSHRGERMMPESATAATSPRSRSWGPRRRGLTAVSPPRSTERLAIPTVVSPPHMAHRQVTHEPRPRESAQQGLFPAHDGMGYGANKPLVRFGSVETMRQHSGHFPSSTPDPLCEATKDRLGDYLAFQTCTSPRPVNPKNPFLVSPETTVAGIPANLDIYCLNCKLLEQRLKSDELELNYLRQRKVYVDSQMEALQQQVQGLETNSELDVDKMKCQEIEALRKEKMLWDDIARRAAEMGLYEQRSLVEMQAALKGFSEGEAADCQERLRESRQLIASLRETLMEEKKLRHDVVSETEVRLISENAELLSTLRAKETALVERAGELDKLQLDKRNLGDDLKELQAQVAQSVSVDLLGNLLDSEEKMILTSAWCDLPEEVKEKLNSPDTIREYLQESEYLDVTEDVIQCLWYRYRCTQKAYNALKSKLESLGITEEDHWATLAEIDQLLYARDDEIRALKHEVALQNHKVENMKSQFQQKLEAALFEKNKLQLEVEEMRLCQATSGRSNSSPDSHNTTLSEATVALRQAYDFFEVSHKNRQLQRKVEFLEASLHPPQSSSTDVNLTGIRVEDLQDEEDMEQLRQKCLRLFTANRNAVAAQKELERNMKDLTSLDRGEQHRATVLEYQISAAEDAHATKLKERDLWIASLEEKLRDLEARNDDLKSRLEHERRDKEQSRVEKNVADNLQSSRFGSTWSMGNHQQTPAWNVDEMKLQRVSGKNTRLEKGPTSVAPGQHQHWSHQQDEMPSREQSILKSPQKQGDATTGGAEHVSASFTRGLETPLHLRKQAAEVEAAKKDVWAELGTLEQHSVLDLSRLKHALAAWQDEAQTEKSALQDEWKHATEELRHERERAHTLAEKKNQLQSALEDLKRRFSGSSVSTHTPSDGNAPTDAEGMREALETTQKLVKNMKRRHLEERQNLTTRITYHVENEKVLQQTLDTLRDEMALLEKQLSIFKQENERLTQGLEEQEKLMWRERENYDKQLEASRQALEELRREFKVKCTDALHLQEELVASRAECRGLHNEVNNLTCKWNGEMNTVKQVTSKMMNINSQLISAKRRLAQQQDELERLQQAQRRWKEQSPSRDQLENEVKCLLAEKEQLSQQLEWMKERWRETDGQLTHERTCHITLKARTESLEEEVEWLRSQLMHAKNKCNRVENHLQDPKARADLIQTLIHQSHNKAQILLHTDVDLPAMNTLWQQQQHTQSQKFNEESTSSMEKT